MMTVEQLLNRKCHSSHNGVLHFNHQLHMLVAKASVPFHMDNSASLIHATIYHLNYSLLSGLGTRMGDLGVVNNAIMTTIISMASEEMS